MLVHGRICFVPLSRIVAVRASEAGFRGKCPRGRLQDDRSEGCIELAAFGHIEGGDPRWFGLNPGGEVVVVDPRIDQPPHLIPVVADSVASFVARLLADDGTVPFFDRPTFTPNSVLYDVLPTNSLVLRPELMVANGVPRGNLTDREVWAMLQRIRYRHGSRSQRRFWKRCLRRTFNPRLPFWAWWKSPYDLLVELAPNLRHEQQAPGVSATLSRPAM
ncbi:MAG: hypothetical protein AAF928_00345 [Myxococcota bacterium]